jgi:hypothetical protein
MVRFLVTIPCLVLSQQLTYKFSDIQLMVIEGESPTRVANMIGETSNKRRKTVDMEAPAEDSVLALCSFTLCLPMTRYQ